MDDEQTEAPSSPLTATDFTISTRPPQASAATWHYPSRPSWSASRAQFCFGPARSNESSTTTPTEPRQPRRVLSGLRADVDYATSSETLSTQILKQGIWQAAYDLANRAGPKGRDPKRGRC